MTVGPHACRILLESVHNLRQSLIQQDRGGANLIVRYGSTVPILLNIIDELTSKDNNIEITEMVWNEEPGIYEQQLSKQVYQTITQNYPTIQIKYINGLYIIPSQ